VKRIAVAIGDRSRDVSEWMIETTAKMSGAAIAWITRARGSVVAAIAIPMVAAQRAQPNKPKAMVIAERFHSDYRFSTKWVCDPGDANSER